MPRHDTAQLASAGRIAYTKYSISRVLISLSSRLLTPHDLAPAGWRQTTALFEDAISLRSFRYLFDLISFASHNVRRRCHQGVLKFYSFEIRLPSLWHFEFASRFAEISGLRPKCRAGEAQNANSDDESVENESPRITMFCLLESADDEDAVD